MSHSKDAEEKEDIDCLLEHLEILKQNILIIEDSLIKADKIPKKSEIIQMIEKALEEGKQVNKRLDYMIKDLKGEI